MTVVIREISDFDNFLDTLKSHIKVSFESQNGILESFLVPLNDFWKFEIESNFVKISNFSFPQSLIKFQILITFSTFSNLTSK